MHRIPINRKNDIGFSGYYFRIDRKLIDDSDQYSDHRTLESVSVNWPPIHFCPFFFQCLFLKFLFTVPFCSLTFFVNYRTVKYSFYVKDKRTIDRRRKWLGR